MRNAETKPKRDIGERTLRFALRIVKLANALPQTVAGEIIARQAMRSGTGVGANVEEAQAASTPKKFSRRMQIAQSEARVAMYWRRLASEPGMVKRERINGSLTEADELVRILTVISKRASKRSKMRGAPLIPYSAFNIPHSIEMRCQ